MPDTRISAMPAATLPLTGLEYIPIVQGGGNFICQVNDVSGGGAPTWTTPTAGALTWRDSAHTESVSLSDAGLFNVTAQFGGSIVNMNGVSNVAALLFQNNGFALQANGAGIVALQTAGGGSVVLGNFANSLIEGGFTSTSRGYTDGAPGGTWATSSPADVETAINRIAAAVAGLLGGPIP